MGKGTAIGRVRGLGSAKEGAHHWWQQRVTAGGNILLMLWFFIASRGCRATTTPTSTSGSRRPGPRCRWCCWCFSVFYHFRLGLQVVIEDYQHDASRVAALLALNLFTIGAGATAIFAILKIAFTGTPN